MCDNHSVIVLQSNAKPFLAILIWESLSHAHATYTYKWQCVVADYCSYRIITVWPKCLAACQPNERYPVDHYRVCVCVHVFCPRMLVATRVLIGLIWIAQNHASFDHNIIKTKLYQIKTQTFYYHHFLLLIFSMAWIIHHHRKFGFTMSIIQLVGFSNVFKFNRIQTKTFHYFFLSLSSYTALSFFFSIFCWKTITTSKFEGNKTFDVFFSLFSL